MSGFVGVVCELTNTRISVLKIELVFIFICFFCLVRFISVVCESIYQLHFLPLRFYNITSDFIQMSLVFMGWLNAVVDSVNISPGNLICWANHKNKWMGSEESLSIHHRNLWITLWPEHFHIMHFTIWTSLSHCWRRRQRKHNEEWESQTEQEWIL